MSALMEQLEQTVQYIQSQYNHQPTIGIVLGSGLGNFVSEIKVETEIAYEDIPNFPVSTVKGHLGKLVFGELEGKKVVAMAGRFHFYEGYSSQQIAFPIRVMKLLGVQHLFLSNASGCVNTDFKVGDLMLINDHISFFISNPLIGPNEDSLGTRFPDMSEPYSKSLIQKAKEIGAELNYDLKEGIYLATTGPTFETHAEYQMIKVLGADVVGMSTVQEVIVARHCNMEVLAISVITDMGIRDTEDEITHEEVLAAAKAAEPKMSNIFKKVAATL